MLPNRSYNTLTENGNWLGSIFCPILISITLSNELLGKYNPEQLKLEMPL